MNRRRWLPIALGAALLALGLPASAAEGQATILDEEFGVSVPFGSWSDCDHAPGTRAAWCGGLSDHYRDTWWAYPDGWPDTATQRGYPVGGLYDPTHTLWVSDGALHIRMFRVGDGPVHSTAVVPKPLMGQRFGWFEERFRVSGVSAGYKSAHLLWPSDESCQGCEIDFPENEWTDTIGAYLHRGGHSAQMSFDTGQTWSGWHTSRIEWTPTLVRFLLDGRVVGSTTGNIPNSPMDWVLQNESALSGPVASPNSWAQMDIDWVRGGS